jgi:hypothetical protein
MNDQESGGEAPDENPERRGVMRKRAVVGAILANRSGSMTWDCRIRNLSKSGAQVVLSQEQFVPDECVLINLKDAIAYEAHLEWRRPPAFGIKFLKAHDLQSAL